MSNSRVWLEKYPSGVIGVTDGSDAVHLIFKDAEKLKSLSDVQIIGKLKLQKTNFSDPEKKIIERWAERIKEKQEMQEGRCV